MKKPIRITFELPDDFTAWELAQFVKRVRFDQAYELTETHLERSERTAKAEGMIRGLTLLQDALREVHIAPR
jgi:hypothetical protein